MLWVWTAVFMIVGWLSLVSQIVELSGHYVMQSWASLNTMRPRQNGRHFAGDIFKCILLKGNVWLSFKISLKFVPKFWINTFPAWIQTMAWGRPGDKPLSEPMMVNLVMHICVTRPQWVNIKTIHYNDVTMASHIISLTIVYSTVYSGADQRKHQRSASLAFICGIHLGPVNSPHKGPVTRKMLPFHDVIMFFWYRDSYFRKRWS